jgi:hypothetical protein
VDGLTVARRFCSWYARLIGGWASNQQARVRRWISGVGAVCLGIRSVSVSSGISDVQLYRTVDGQMRNTMYRVHEGVTCVMKYQEIVNDGLIEIGDISISFMISWANKVRIICDFWGRRPLPRERCRICFVMSAERTALGSKNRRRLSWGYARLTTAWP